ncbi:MAG: tRNA epoxyqueuosine(34) reductase QueG [Nitrospinaceae bacterium]
MNSRLLDQKVKSIEHAARDLGFDGFGIARPAIPRAVRRFKRWLGLGYEGEMAYMSRWTEKRSDPGNVLPGVQSVICLRTNYLTAEKNLDFLEDARTGDISLYALHEDYHEVISARLKTLEEKIVSEFEGCRTRGYVDTGPVLEKPLAQKAGIGWIGKHTNLLSEGIGSWYFLSEILADVWLPESAEAADRCGTCTRCIDICPTRAIVAPYVLDSRKCISYLTIELKGVIPVEFRKAIGNRIYGCDDCQIVCPWNSCAVKTPEEAFQEPPATRRLIDLIQLDDEAFRRRFRNSPIKRTKRRGFLRNVAVALGNSNDPEAVPPLIQALDDAEPLIRAHVVWALGELLREKALPVITRKLSGESDESVLTEILRVKEKFDQSAIKKDGQ